MKWAHQKLPQNQHQFMSFSEYYEVFATEPWRECRQTAHYFKDLFDYYQREESGAFKLFKKNHYRSPALAGQNQAQEAIYHYFKNFIKEGHNNKFVLLVGPNGSAKSTIIKKIMEAAQEYSQTPAGQLFTFSWIFPKDVLTKGTLGLSNQTPESKKIPSYAHLQEQEINVIIHSELRESPLYLIPKKQRQEIIDDLFKDNISQLQTLKKSQLYHGELSNKNKMIYDELLKSYHGDYLEVLKHIRVERFYIGKQQAQGAVTIEPQMHVDATMTQITMDRRLANLPPSLQSLNLFQLSGETIMANRGVLEFSDLLKRPLDGFKYLLTTTESGQVNLRGVVVNLDILLMGTSNEIHLASFKKHPDYNSFRGRFEFIRVPYLTEYRCEMEIYKEQIENLQEKCSFAPHALELLCLWAVMGRLRAPLKSHYKHEIGSLIEQFTPLEKALFLSEKKTPSRFKTDQKQILIHAHQHIKNEFTHETVYEGLFGISPRTMKQIIYELSRKQTHVHFLDVLDFLSTFIKKKNEFDFLNMEKSKGYHDQENFLRDLESYHFDLLDQEVRESLGLIDERSYEDYIKKYIAHINSLLKGEKIKNPITNSYEKIDTFFIEEFEKNINLNEKVETYRSHLISRLAAFSLDYPDKELIYTDIFDDLVIKLKESFREEQKVVIKGIAKNLDFYIKDYFENSSELHKNEEYHKITTLLENLNSKFKYPFPVALDLVKKLIQRSYS